MIVSTAPCPPAALRPGPTAPVRPGPWLAAGREILHRAALELADQQARPDVQEQILRAQASLSNALYLLAEPVCGLCGRYRNPAFPDHCTCDAEGLDL